MPSSFDPTDPRLLARRAETYALAFALAGEALAYQERSLEQMRGRGARLVATAAVTMSLFGGPALGTPRPGPALYTAIGAFIGVCICVLGLLWPHRLIVTSDVDTVIAKYAEPRCVATALVHRDLALDRANTIVRNRRRLDQMARVSQVALMLTGVEIVAWVVNYASGL